MFWRRAGKRYRWFDLAQKLLRNRKSELEWEARLSLDLQNEKVARDIAPIGCQFIDLATDEIMIEPSLSMRGAVRAANAGMNRSTTSIDLISLRRVVTERLSVKTGMRWSTEDVVIFADPRRALREATLALLSPGDEAIIIRPCAPAILGQVLIAGATPVFVDARPPRYIPDARAIRAAITPRTKAIVINSPNNPTGTVYDRATLSRIGELVLDAGIWIISDESYSSFVFTGARRHVSVVMAHPSVCSRTILVSTLSNELATMGWRLGYLAAPAEIALAVMSLRCHAAVHPSIIPRSVILRHIQVSDDSLEREIHQRIADARNIGLHILSDLRDVTPPRADGSFFFYLDLGRLLSALENNGPVGSTDEIVRLLQEEVNVACVPGRSFGDANGLRLSFGAPPVLVETGLRRVVHTLNSLRSR